MLCFSLAAALPAFSQEQKKAAPRLVLPDNVERVSDLVYAKYGDRELRLDLYLPKPRPAQPVPAIITIRGGGWRAGDKQGFARIAAGLAARGLAAACIEYRVLPDFAIRDAVNDTKAAVRWVRVEGKRYGLKTGALGAIGGSAGGHLVALLGTSHNVASLEGAGGHPGVSSRVQAVVAMAPVVDFMAMAKARQESGGGAVRSILGGDIRLAKLLSPVVHLDRESAPMLLIHSNADKTVPFAQSEEMLALAQKAGVPVELMTIEGAPHAFWNMPQWSAETLERSARFFHSVLDPR